jgi:uncharacterized protein YaiI (UPF0178 family)
MPIWVDADACPVVIKDMLYRAARRTGMPLTLVANSFLRVPPSPLIRAIQVPAGFDAADNLIAERVAAGDLVITADIPLAAAARQLVHAGHDRRTATHALDARPVAQQRRRYGRAGRVQPARQQKLRGRTGPLAGAASVPL